MIDIKIVPMNITHLEQIKDNLATNFDNFWTYNTLKQELENTACLNSYYFIAMQGEEIVGFMGFIVVIDELQIMNIVVKKEKRSLGIGSLLLQFIISFAKKQKLNCITLEVNEKNASAIHLYKKYNFNQVGIRKKYYNNEDDAILMNLQIV